MVGVNELIPFSILVNNPNNARSNTGIFPLFVNNGQNPFKATLVSQVFIPTGFRSPHLRKE